MSTLIMLCVVSLTLTSLRDNDTHRQIMFPCRDRDARTKACNCRRLHEEPPKGTHMHPTEKNPVY